MDIAMAQNVAWQTAEDKGFHDDLKDSTPRTAALVRLCLVHTEVSEAAQEVKRHWDGEVTDEQRQVFGDELADIVIRVLDMAGSLDINLNWRIIQKMDKNALRPHLYGTAGAGGI